MKSSRVFGVIVAAGLMATSAVMAQESNAANAPSSTKPEARRPRYGQYVAGPATPDADGIPVAKPNPISRQEDEGVFGGIGYAPGELTDKANAYPADNNSSGQGY
jgi:hypothetical protein